MPKYSLTLKTNNFKIMEDIELILPKGVEQVTQSDYIRINLKQEPNKRAN